MRLLARFLIWHKRGWLIRKAGKNPPPTIMKGEKTGEKN
jgi:hypothetical protein